MTKKILLFSILSLMLATAFAQDDEPRRPVQDEAPKKGFDKSRLFFGGNFGLNFGTYTVINVSPQLGYRFTDRFAAGAGINYIYYNYKSYYSDGSLYSKDIYSYAGMNVFGRVYPIQQFFIQAQPELNYVWGKTKYYDGYPDYKLKGQFVPSLLLGGGAAIPAGSGAITISVLYDVLQNRLSPYYHQAVYGIGFNFGF